MIYKRRDNTSFISQQCFIFHPTTWGMKLTVVMKLHLIEFGTDVLLDSCLLLCLEIKLQRQMLTTKSVKFTESCDQNYCIHLDFNFSPQLDANETEGRKYRIRPDFKEDPSFKRLTDHNHTAVHIPTDIYDGCESAHTHAHPHARRHAHKPNW